MAEESQVIEESEAIRLQMEDTRASLTEKLETLEQQVVDTVQGAKTAVTDTVETVKEAVQGTVDSVKSTVQDTVSSVKEAFDLPRQVDRHPWLMLGGSVLVGFLAGRLLHRAAGSSSAGAWPGRPAEGSNGLWAKSTNGTHDGLRGRIEADRQQTPRAPAEPGFFSKLTDQISPELSKLKGLAIGAGMSILRDALSNSMPPQVGADVSSILDSVTTKLGGEPIQGSFLASQPSGQTGGARDEDCNAAEVGGPVGTAHGSRQESLGQPYRQ